jgi:hypothetical protein
MEEVNIAIWPEEGIDGAMERLRFALIEMGINLTIAHVYPDCTVYSLGFAEKIGDGEKKN